VINGVKLVESWSRGTSDFADGNGLTTGYDVYVLENGDNSSTDILVLPRTLGRASSP
jgi:hypothetical protein